MALAKETSAGVTYFTQPSQSALSEQRAHNGRLAQYMESTLDIFLVMICPGYDGCLIRWFVELLSIPSCLAYIAVMQQCTGIAYCHLLSSPTARSLPTLESSDEHERLALFSEPKYVNWQTTSR